MTEHMLNELRGRLESVRNAKAGGAAPTPELSIDEIVEALAEHVSHSNSLGEWRRAKRLAKIRDRLARSVNQ